MEKNMSEANTYQPAPINKDDNLPPLWDLVIKDVERYYRGNEKTKSAIIQLMRERDLFGVKKHGCHLKVNNGRLFYADSIAEILDATVYLKGLSEEDNAVDDELDNIYKDSVKLLIRLYQWKNHE